MSLYCDLQGLTMIIMMHKWSIVSLPPGIYRVLVEFLSFSSRHQSFRLLTRLVGILALLTAQQTSSGADVCNIYCAVQSSHEVCLIRINQQTIRLDQVYHWTKWYFVFRSRRKFIASSQNVKC